jgi:hypothetical protein
MAGGRSGTDLMTGSARRRRYPSGVAGGLLQLRHGGVLERHPAVLRVFEDGHRVVAVALPNQLGEVPVQRRVPTGAGDLGSLVAADQEDGGVGAGDLRGRVAGGVRGLDGGRVVRGPGGQAGPALGDQRSGKSR